MVDTCIYYHPKGVFGSGCIKTVIAREWVPPALEDVTSTFTKRFDGFPVSTILMVSTNLIRVTAP